MKKNSFRFDHPSNLPASSANHGRAVLKTLIMREEPFASTVDVGYGCGNPNINHD
jgi:hypothetical protein